MIASKRYLHVAPVVYEQIEDQAAFYREEAAENVVGRWEAAVRSAIRSLRTMPQRGALCNFSRRSLRDLRRLRIDGFQHHILLYRFDPDSNVVSVLGVTHASRDLEAALVRIPPPGEEQ